MAEEGGGTTIVIKKIKKGGHGHHGGAWKVAYADFVTAMMAFFLVMWIVAMSQETKKGIENYFKDPIKYLMGAEKINTGVFESSRGAQMVSGAKSGGVVDSSQEGGLSRLHLLAQRIDAGMAAFKPEVLGLKVYPDRIQFAITAESLFAPGSDLLKPDAEALLNRIAGILKSIDAYVMVEAHTDDLPPENERFETNWELSGLRAAHVVRYFIEGHFMDPSKLSPMGAGEFRPIADNRTPEGRAKNRRVDFYIIPDKENKFGIRSPAAEGRPVTTSGE